MSLKLTAVATFAGLVLVVSTERTAQAEESAASKAACVDAFDRGQSLQNTRNLVDARARYVACASEACPDVVREDCARLLQEVDGAIPTVVLSATLDGRDTTDARVSLDGERLQGALEGRAIALDPGSHVARFERLGSAPIEVRIVAREGEKNRLVTGSFVLPRAIAPAPAPVKVEGRHTPVVPIVLAGTGLLAIGSSVFFRMQADDRAAELRGSCAPSCDPAERSALSDKLVFSNVSLAIGLGALALSAVTWVLDSKR